MRYSYTPYKTFFASYYKHTQTFPSDRSISLSVPINQIYIIEKRVVFLSRWGNTDSRIARVDRVYYCAVSFYTATVPDRKYPQKGI